MGTHKPVRAEAASFLLSRRVGGGTSDRLFDRLGWNAIRPQDPERAVWMPELEALERNGEFIVRMDVPGLKKPDVTVEMTEQEVVVRGERTREAEEHDDRFCRTERSYGSFLRTMPLPEGVTIDQARHRARRRARSPHADQAARGAPPASGDPGRPRREGSEARRVAA
jgi:HSP20 family molecular chaperone IbpA